jgi:hypothetical protein
MVAGMVEAGQRCDEPLHEKEEGCPYQGHFGKARPRGDHPLQMGRLLLMDRTSPEAAGRFPEREEYLAFHVFHLSLILVLVV